MGTNVERWMLVFVLCASLVSGGCDLLIDDPRPKVTVQGPQCRDVVDTPMWASWPMPNSPNTNLPNPANYASDADKDVVIDNITGLMWQRTASPGTFSWEKAKEHCDTLKHGGFTDWRLPTRIELVALVDPTRAFPSIDTNAFPGATSDEFWTSSVQIGEPNGWYVHFTNGWTSVEATTTSYRARCVRC